MPVSVFKNNLLGSEYLSVQKINQPGLIFHKKILSDK